MLCPNPIAEHLVLIFIKKHIIDSFGCSWKCFLPAPRFISKVIRGLPASIAIFVLKPLARFQTNSKAAPVHILYRVYQRFRMNLVKTRQMIIFLSLFTAFDLSNLILGSSVITSNWLNRTTLIKLSLSKSLIHAVSLFLLTVLSTFLVLQTSLILCKT